MRHIGSAERAAAVKRELSQLQQDVQVGRELNARVKQANQLLREVQRQREPLLNAQGFVFHRRTVRKPRNKPANRVTQHQLHKNPTRTINQGGIFQDPPATTKTTNEATAPPH